MDASRFFELLMNRFPKLYPIVDAEVLAARGIPVLEFARALRAAGVTMLQYRDKRGGDQTILRNAELMGEMFEGEGRRLIMNDRADLMMLARWDGVHVGQ